MAYGRAFSYNYEKVSARDIADFVQELGSETQFYNRLNNKDIGFLIKGTSIKIRIPDVDYIKGVHFHIAVSLHGDVYWDTYDEIYQSNSELKKEHEKIFNKLKRKFQMKKGDHPKAFKDLDWITSLTSSKKSWWPFK